MPDEDPTSRLDQLEAVVSQLIGAMGVGIKRKGDQPPLPQQQQADAKFDRWMRDQERELRDMQFAVDANDDECLLPQDLAQLEFDTRYKYYEHIDEFVVDHSWHFTQSSTTDGVVTLGKVYIGTAAKTVTSFPVDGLLAGVTTTTHYWVVVDREYATATWGSGASVPANTETIEYWEVLEIICVASLISHVIERCCSDIRVTLFS